MGNKPAVAPSQGIIWVDVPTWTNQRPTSHHCLHIPARLYWAAEHQHRLSPHQPLPQQYREKILKLSQNISGSGFLLMANQAVLCAHTSVGLGTDSLRLSYLARSLSYPAAQTG